VCVQGQGFATTSNDSIMLWWNRSLPTAASALTVCPLLSRRMWCGGDAAQQGDKPPQPVFQPLNLYNQIVKSYDSKAAAYRDLGANMRIKSHCARVFKSRSIWSLMYLLQTGYAIPKCNQAMSGFLDPLEVASPNPAESCSNRPPLRTGRSLQQEGVRQMPAGCSDFSILD